MKYPMYFFVIQCLLMISMFICLQRASYGVNGVNVDDEEEGAPLAQADIEAGSLVLLLSLG